MPPHLVEAVDELCEAHPEGSVSRPAVQQLGDARLVLPQGRRGAPRAAPFGRRLAVAQPEPRVGQPHHLLARGLAHLDEWVDQVAHGLRLASLHRRRLALARMLRRVSGAEQMALGDKPLQPRPHVARADLLNGLPSNGEPGGGRSRGRGARAAAHGSKRKRGHSKTAGLQ
eukprot:472151-Pleurochrysis_carterae.AAC.6